MGLVSIGPYPMALVSIGPCLWVQVLWVHIYRSGIYGSSSYGSMSMGPVSMGPSMGPPHTHLVAGAGDGLGEAEEGEGEVEEPVLVGAQPAVPLHQLEQLQAAQPHNRRRRRGDGRDDLARDQLALPHRHCLERPPRPPGTPRGALWTPMGSPWTPTGPMGLL